MDLVFNEISLTPAQKNIHDANVLMDNFLDTLKKAKEYGFENIRVPEEFYQSVLCPNYCISDWLSSSSVRSTSKIYLMSICKSPFIKDDQDQIEEEYILRSFFFENMAYSRTEVEGLAIAFVANTLTVSLKTHDTWFPNNLNIEEDNGITHNVLNVSDCSTVSYLDDWIESRLGPILKPTKLPPSNKSISLREDHGKDKLKALSDKLINCEYVIGIINSLPFNPTERKFIRKIRENGLIEIVLTDTDQGFGLLVKTTGTSLTQTEKIAKIIGEKYS